METLSEYNFIMRCPTQCLHVVESPSAPYRIEPLTRKEKILNILSIIGYIFLGIVLLGITAIAIWGLIQWPWMIIFVIAELLVPIGRN